MTIYLVIGAQAIQTTDVRSADRPMSYGEVATGMCSFGALGNRAKTWCTCRSMIIGACAHSTTPRSLHNNSLNELKRPEIQGGRAVYLSPTSSTDQERLQCPNAGPFVPQITPVDQHAAYSSFAARLISTLHRFTCGTRS